MEAEQLTPALCHHGEGPAYSPRWAGPRWVDMLAGDILELRSDGDVARRHVGQVAAIIRPRRRPGWLVAVERGIAVTDDDSLDASLGYARPLWTDPSIRSNEGGCDPDGNFYLGTMAFDATAGAGSLYRIDPDGRVSTVLESVTISNGIGWSPDGERAYYIDTGTGQIDVFDWSAQGGLRARRRWAPVPGGGADGLAVDAEGGVWVAVFGGSAVHRYDADGRLDAVVSLPVRQPTAVAFAGEGLTDLIVTTSRQGLGAAAEPAAGALFVIRSPGVRGAPVHAYAG